MTSNISKSGINFLHSSFFDCSSSKNSVSFIFSSKRFCRSIALRALLKISSMNQPKVVTSNFYNNFGWLVEFEIGTSDEKIWGKKSEKRVTKILDISLHFEEVRKMLSFLLKHFNVFGGTLTCFDTFFRFAFQLFHRRRFFQYFFELLKRS